MPNMTTISNFAAVAANNLNKTTNSTENATLIATQQVVTNAIGGSAQKAPSEVQNNIASPELNNSATASPLTSNADTTQNIANGTVNEKVWVNLLI